MGKERSMSHYAKMLAKGKLQRMQLHLHHVTVCNYSLQRNLLPQVLLPTAILVLQLGSLWFQGALAVLACWG